MKRSEFLQSSLAASAVAWLGASPAPYRILVLGDSVTWGQGLLEEQKMHRLLQRRLQADGLTVAEPVHLARSGANLGIDRFEVVDREIPVDFIDNEIPNGRPSAFEQCDIVATRYPDTTFDLILLSGGINDVSIFTTFNPFTSTELITQLTRLQCYDHMSALLDRIYAQFCIQNPQTRVFVLGYYSVLGESSRVTDVATFLRAIGVTPPVQVRLRPNSYKKRNTDVFPNDALLANSRAFAAESSRSLSQAVAAARGRLSPAFEFVPSGISEVNAAYTEHPFIFDLDDNGRPRDELYAKRKCLCEKKTGLDQFICERASVGHPNTCGARAYADQIYRTLVQRSAVHA